MPSRARTELGVGERAVPVAPLEPELGPRPENRGLQAVQVVFGAVGERPLDQLLGLGVPSQLIGDDRGQAAQRPSSGVHKAGIPLRLGGSLPSTSRPGGPPGRVWRCPE